MKTTLPTRHPFKRGDLISNGKKRFVVNRTFTMANGQHRMLIGDYLWHGTEGLVKHTKEVACDGYYKV